MQKKIHEQKQGLQKAQSQIVEDPKMLKQLCESSKKEELEAHHNNKSD